MHKISLMIVAALCAVLFAGCAGMQISNKTQYQNEKISFAGEPVAHIYADNWGLYLFNIPLLTGSTIDPGSVTVFEDTVNVSYILKMTSGKAKALGATTLADIVSRHSANGFLFYIHEVSLSANALK